MVKTLADFKKYYDLNKNNIQNELYLQAEQDVNGDDKYFEKIGKEIEKHPIHCPKHLGSKLSLF